MLVFDDDPEGKALLAARDQDPDDLGFILVELQILEPVCVAHGEGIFAPLLLVLDTDTGLEKGGDAVFDLEGVALAGKRIVVGFEIAADDAGLAAGEADVVGVLTLKLELARRGLRRFDLELADGRAGLGRAGREECARDGRTCRYGARSDEPGPHAYPPRLFPIIIGIKLQ